MCPYPPFLDSSTRSASSPSSLFRYKPTTPMHTASSSNATKSISPPLHCTSWVQFDFLFLTSSLCSTGESETQHLLYRLFYFPFNMGSVISGLPTCPNAKNGTFEFLIICLDWVQSSYRQAVVLVGGSTDGQKQRGSYSTRRVGEQLELLVFLLGSRTQISLFTPYPQVNA